MSEETEEEEGVAIGFWEYVGRDLSVSYLVWEFSIGYIFEKFCLFF